MSTLDPEEAAAIGNPEIGEIAPTTRMGPVSLTVADLDRSVAYYGDQIGLEALERSGDRASLGTGDAPSSWSSSSSPAQPPPTG